MSATEVGFALVALLLAIVAGFGVAFARRDAARREALREQGRLVEPDIATPPRDRPASRGRPVWANPWLWVGICAVFAFLGLVVWPWLFGGIFLVFPFVWVSRPKGPSMDPRTNGHGSRDGGSF